MNKIDKITMEYMSNKIFNEYVEQNKDEDKQQYEKDERFYKKRLYVLYKELFKSKNSLDKTLVHAFEKFNSVAIESLKQQDTQEIVQTQLGNLPMEKKVGFDETIPLDASMENTDTDQQRDLDAFQNNNNVKTCTLDNFIIRKPHNKKEPKPPPQKINVKLKTKDLQNKNVPKKKKKKNIDNKYEESQEKDTKEIKT